MTDEKFALVAWPLPDDCFSVFSETENRKDIGSGNPDVNSPYSWIEKSFEIRLVHLNGPAYHICSLSASMPYEVIKNHFVGNTNEIWQESPDPECLESVHDDESGYMPFKSVFDSRFIVKEFSLPLDGDDSLTRPDSLETEAGQDYLVALWNAAREHVQELACNSDFSEAPILSLSDWRAYEKENATKMQKAQKHA